MTNTGFKNPNRLINEKSPYLLQHAYNPVDWFPWCNEAFEKAASENKPVFLSIGYSTCHWCHVMEKESFEDKTTADLLNKVFIPVKVDREERPDIDSIYMTVCQMTTGRGGWPLTIFMTPDKKPFFAGTYFPKVSGNGRIGLMDLIERVNTVWNENHSEIISSADQLTDSLTEYLSLKPGKSELGEYDLRETYNYFADRFDSTHGGFGHSPKFPSPHNLLFLLRFWKRTGEEHSLKMVTKTLTEMRCGGIFDQIGYGFHRYSTDSKWLLPHFEKMLYDQAMLALAYIETYQATGDYFFASTAEQIFEYVLRDMTNTNGGFFSAEDADSDGDEGKYYVWTTDEISSALGKKNADSFIQIYNLKNEGNFYDEASRKLSGANILYLETDTEANTDEHQTAINELMIKSASSRQKLFDVRAKRIPPLKDDKILTDWNGLMIASLAKAGRVLNKPLYTDAARNAVDFINTNLMSHDDMLLHRYRDGSAEIDAHLDDYAFLIWGLIELYETTFEPLHLLRAIDLQKKQIELFWDYTNGGFYFTSDKGEKLLVRNKDIYNGAIPSGNSVSYLNLIRLSKITADTYFNEHAKKMLDAFSAKVKESLPGSTMFLSALDFNLGPSTEIVFAGNAATDYKNSLINEINKRYIPNCAMVYVDEQSVDNPILKAADYLKSYKTVDNKFTVYVCSNYVCNKPVTTAEELRELLEKF